MTNFEEHVTDDCERESSSSALKLCPVKMIGGKCDMICVFVIYSFVFFHTV